MTAMTTINLDGRDGTLRIECARDTIVGPIAVVRPAGVAWCIQSTDPDLLHALAAALTEAAEQVTDAAEGLPAMTVVSS